MDCATAMKACAKIRHLSKAGCLMFLEGLPLFFTAWHSVKFKLCRLSCEMQIIGLLLYTLRFYHSIISQFFIVFTIILALRKQPSWFFSCLFFFCKALIIIKTHLIHIVRKSKENDFLIVHSSTLSKAFCAMTLVHEKKSAELQRYVVRFNYHSCLRSSGFHFLFNGIF